MTPMIISRLGTLNEAQEEEEKGSFNDNNTDSLYMGTKNSCNKIAASTSNHVTSERQQ